MVLLDLFHNNVTIKYKSTVCSKATLLVSLSILIIIFAPLVLVYRSKGYWLKSHTFYEQPDVRFKYKYFVVAESLNMDNVISCGNIPNITEFIGIDQNCYMINVREEDYNDDNKIDEIHFQIKILNTQMNPIHSLKLFFILDYKIRTTCPMQMESMIMSTDSFGLPISKYFISANLKLWQSLPLPCWSNYLDTRYNYSVVTDYNEITTNRWINDFVYKYSRRNISTSLDNVIINTEYGISDNIEISLSLGIPENAVRYKPGISQELKHFWQQYISIALIFYWLMYNINSYVFTNRLIPAWKKIPWEKVH